LKNRVPQVRHQSTIQGIKALRRCLSRSQSPSRSLCRWFLFPFRFVHTFFLSLQLSNAHHILLCQEWSGKASFLHKSGSTRTQQLWCRCPSFSCHQLVCGPTSTPECGWNDNDRTSGGCSAKSTFHDRPTFHDRSTFYDKSTFHGKSPSTSRWQGARDYLDRNPSVQLVEWSSDQYSDMRNLPVARPQCCQSQLAVRDYHLKLLFYREKGDPTPREKLYEFSKNFFSEILTSL